MGIGDGAVLGLTQMVNHGSAVDRWDLVVMGDGYTQQELDDGVFLQDVNNLIDTLRNTPPFKKLWRAINLYRIDVQSAQSGADRPAPCYAFEDPADHDRATYYDARFCSRWGGGNLPHLLTIDGERARDDAVALLPQVDQVVVIVNSDEFGGSGGPDAAVYSRGAGPLVGIHELGHTAFELADEHDDGNKALPPAEPLEPNVTLSSILGTLKWRELVAAGTPLPTMCNPICSTCVAPAVAPAAGTIGCFEGAQYVRCGMYRPTLECMMRWYTPFCPICVKHIRGMLVRHLPWWQRLLAAMGWL